MLASPHYPRQKTKKSKVPKFDKCLQITSPFSKITETAPVPPNRLSDISIAIHSNSIAGYVINRFAGKGSLPAIEFEWIAIEMSESLCGGKGAVSVILKLNLLWFEGIFSHFWHVWFLCFLTCVMRRSIANINPQIIRFDAVDFSGHHSTKLCFFWRSVYFKVFRTNWHSIIHCMYSQLCLSQISWDWRNSFDLEKI